MDQDMAGQRTIIIVLLPERGAFNASFVLAKQLSQQGYRVVYLGPPDFAEHVAAQGLAYQPIEFPKSVPTDPPVSLKGKIRAWWSQQVEGYTAFGELLENVAAQLRNLSPAVVLLDPLMWSYAGPFLAEGIPIVGLNTTLASAFKLSVPPVFSSILPGPNGRTSRLRNLIRWSPILIKYACSKWVEDLRRICILGPYRASRYRARSIIKRYGGRLATGEYGPRLVVPELVMAPREFDFPAASASVSLRRVYIGSSVDVTRQDGIFDWTKLPDGKPLLYCSLGTYSDAYPHAKRLFEAVIEAFRGRPEWNVILQTGDVAESESFGPLPSHIVVERRTPQIEILERASVFISHGGFSSVREAIFFSVPTVIFPCWLDQPGNAARVVFHGLGVCGDISRVDAAMVNDLVSRAQTDEIRKNVSMMCRIFRQQSDCAAGVEWIEEHFPAFAKRNHVSTIDSHNQSAGRSM